MDADLYIKNARVVTENSIFDGGVLVNRGKIAQLVTGDMVVDARETLDIAGKFLLPGVVDGHVHLNEPGREHWEGYRTGSMAAAAGGVTTMLDMPLNATPPTINRSLLDHKREVVRGESVVDYAHWGGLVNNNLAELKELNDQGVIGFKAFMSTSGTDFARVDDDVLYAGLCQSRELGNLIGVHAENEYVTAYLGQQLRDAGRTDRASWSESRPPAAELEAIQRACYWARVAGGNLHVVHVTIAEGIRAIADAKNNGVHVTAETCPHYLWFDDKDFERIGPSAKCAPPLRSRKQVEELWGCVFDGLVDTIGSDHSPCLLADKARGMQNIWQAWAGILGIQTMLPALLTEGVHKRGLSLPSLMKLLAANPARIFGLYPQKGAILPGADADLVVVDPNKEWTLMPDQLLYKNKHSAYASCSFKGQVERTLVRGETIYLDGQIRVKPGSGQLLRRNQPYNHEVIVG